MINLFRNKNNIKSAKILYKNVTKLIHPHCEFVDINSLQKLHSINFTKNNDIIYQHINNCSNEFGHVANYLHRIDGIKIFSNETRDYVGIPVFVYDEAINEIDLGFHYSIAKQFKLNDIILDQVTTDKINLKNPNYDEVMKILNGLDKGHIQKLDIDTTIEIEVDDLKLYTIIDMEDGNYLAIDNNQIVYRMIHDDNQQYKKVFDSINDFIVNYDGQKETLEHLFE